MSEEPDMDIARMKEEFGSQNEDEDDFRRNEDDRLSRIDRRREEDEALSTMKGDRSTDFPRQNSSMMKQTDDDDGPEK